jgi:predicted amidohydrolase YtcJ
MRFKLHLAWAVGMLCEATLAAPQIVVIHANVFTADAERPRVEAVAIDNGRFSAVGTNADILAMAGAETRVIDAGGRLVAPGLTEAHVHLGSALPLLATPTQPLSMPGMPFPGPSGDQAIAAVAAAAKTPGDWITAFIGPAVARDRRNWRAALDAAAGDRPVMLRAFWGHTTLMNSAALKRLGLEEDVADPLGGWWGRDEAGRLDGRAYESAEWAQWDRIVPPDAARLAAVFQEAAQRYARWGVTSIHLMNNGKSVQLTADALAQLKARQKWTVYAWGGGLPSIAAAWAEMDAAAGRLPLRVRVDGPKWILDGTPIEENALNHAPYPGRPDWHGRSNFTDTQLREMLQTALRRPEGLILHVVGDAETERLFGMMQSLAPAATWVTKRVRVEHGDGIRRNTLAQAVQLGVVVTQNPTHFLHPLPNGAPPRPVETMSMVRSLLKAGVPLAIGSDSGGPETNPFLNMMLVCTYAGNPAEALSREEALLAYTAGGAFVERQEGKRGRIMPGLAADLTVLSQDVLTVPLKSLPATRSLLTLVDGEIVFEDPALVAPGAKVQ